MSCQIVSLHDDAVGSRARIHVGLGFNCFEFTARVNDADINVLWSADGFEAGNDRPSGSGIPLLFPYPGRISGTSFSWGGKSYELEEGDGQGNAIHGFVYDRPWRLIDQDAKSATGEFHASKDDPDILNRWPSDFRIEVKYELAGNTLHATTTIENPGDSDLPFGYGAHPYFCVPLGAGDSSQCVVRVPVTERWELENMLTTGKRVGLGTSEEFQNGIAFGQTQFDDVFGGLVGSAEQFVAEIVDQSSQRSTRLKFDKTFEYCVVYNPAHRESICIEPYTCVPGAIELEQNGIAGGLKTLRSGEIFDSQFAIEIA